MRSGSPVQEVAEELWLGDLQIYPFALLGVVLGRVYLSLGAWIVPLFVAPIFIARQAFASYIQLRAQHEGTLSTLVRALEAKDRYTAGHVERVAKFAEYMGRGLEMKPAELERLRYAALMHDIGKLIVPNQILNKPGKLTEEEFERMRRHEHVSVELLRRIDFLAPIAPSLEAEAAKGSGADPEHADRGPHRHGGRRVRRHDVDPGVPAGADPGDRVRPSCVTSRASSSTPPASRR